MRLAFSRKARPRRFVTLTYRVFLPMMMLLHDNHYYLAPIYQVFFAAGDVALGYLTRTALPRYCAHAPRWGYPVIRISFHPSSDSPD